jgi:hypothetical protein
MAKKLDKMYAKLMKGRKVLTTGPGTAAFPDIELRRGKALKHWQERKRAGKVPAGEFGGWGRIGLMSRYTSAGLKRAKKLGLRWTPLDPRLAKEAALASGRNIPGGDPYDPHGWDRERQTRIRKLGKSTVKSGEHPKTKFHEYYLKHRSAGGRR